MPRLTDDVRILELRELVSPDSLIQKIPLTQKAIDTVLAARTAASEILRGDEDRLLVIVGPCSIHDVAAAKEYAKRLHELSETLKGELHIIMRVYFEKPRTRLGWKGLINDPHLNHGFDINEGLQQARQLLADLAEMGVPAGVEFLDTITPQYLCDLVSWGAIGARTTESQVHRELSSGLSMPIGFKNGTDGNVMVAIDGVAAARHSHHFLSVTKEGHTAIVSTLGNPDCHIILRGGIQQTNYDEKSVMEAAKALDEAKLTPKVMIDCSHGNSEKNYQRQALVLRSICQQISSGSYLIHGLMLESHLNPGNQPLIPNQPLKYGVSITDACVGWEETELLLKELAEAVKARRALQQDEDQLSQVRRKIDAIDKAIEDLLTERGKEALMVAKIKTHNYEQPAQLYRPEREAQVLRQLLSRNQGPFSDEAIETIFRAIMGECLRIQGEVPKRS